VVDSKGEFDATKRRSTPRAANSWKRPASAVDGEFVALTPRDA